MFIQSLYALLIKKVIRWGGSKCKLPSSLVSLLILISGILIPCLSWDAGPWEIFLMEETVSYHLETFLERMQINTEQYARDLAKTLSKSAIGLLP